MVFPSPSVYAQLLADNTSSRASTMQSFGMRKGEGWCASCVSTAGMPMALSTLGYSATTSHTARQSSRGRVMVLLMTSIFCKNSLVSMTW